MPVPNVAPPRSRVRRWDVYLLLVLLLCLFALGPLMQPGYIWGAHDAKNSIYFLYEFNQSIRDGILWPRWGPDWGFGYGYPFWNIYGPLAYFVGEAFLLVGFDYVAAIKLVFALSILGSAAGMYGFIRRVLGSEAAVVAAIIYVYVPYHLFDIFVRAALAESFAMIFLPLVFWAFFELVRRPRFGPLVAAAAAYTAMILSSNVLLLVVTPVLVSMVAGLLLGDVFRNVRDARGAGRPPHPGPILVQLLKRAVPPVLGLGFGLGLSAGFLLPAILERRYVRLDQWFGGRYTFGQDFVHFFQLFSPRWGFGASIPGPDDLTGFQLGLVPLVLALFSLLLLPRLKEPLVKFLVVSWQVFTVATVYLMTPASAWLWRAFPVLQSVQFPWRLGVVTAFGLAVLGGVVVSDDVWAASEAESKSASVGSAWRRHTAMVLLVLLVLLGSYPYLQAQMRPPMENEGPVSLAALFRYQQASDEMTGTTAWARRVPVWSPLAEQVVQGGSIDTKVDYSSIESQDTASTDDQRLAVGSVEMDSVHELVWVYAADDQQQVTFMTAFYPGWKATIYQDLGLAAGDLLQRVGPPIEQPEIKTTPNEGWIVVPVPAGEHFLEVRFEDTPVRRVGKMISALSAVVLLAAAVLRRRWSPKTRFGAEARDFWSG